MDNVRSVIAAMLAEEDSAFSSNGGSSPMLPLPLTPLAADDRQLRRHPDGRFFGGRIGGLPVDPIGAGASPGKAHRRPCPRTTRSPCHRAHARARSRERSSPADAENGGGRTAYRRYRPRFQQHAFDRDRLARSCVAPPRSWARRYPPADRQCDRRSQPRCDADCAPTRLLAAADAGSNRCRLQCVGGLDQRIASAHAGEGVRARNCARGRTMANTC